MSNSYSQIDKIAILCLAFGEDISSQLLKILDPGLARGVLSSIQKLGRVDSDTVEQVLSEFYEVVNSDKKIIEDGARFAKKILLKASAQEDHQLANILSGHNRFAFLENASVEKLSLILKAEHPQTIIAVLAHLPPLKTIEVLKYLPKALVPELLYRLAYLDHMSQEMLDELAEALNGRLLGDGQSQTDQLGGPRKVAQLLKGLDSKSRSNLMLQIRSRDQNLYNEIRQQVFIFEDLKKIPKEELKIVLSHIERNLLIKALRAASEDLIELVCSTMSTRAASMLKEEIGLGAKIRKSEAEEAQDRICEIAIDLQEKGVVHLGLSGKSDQYV